MLSSNVKYILGSLPNGGYEVNEIAILCNTDLASGGLLGLLSGNSTARISQALCLAHNSKYMFDVINSQCDIVHRSQQLHSLAYVRQVWGAHRPA